jgi:DNA-binding Lrp family transcriptional regulator
MQEPDVIDELDLAITNALHLAPRVPWTDLATVLGADATTLARRWRRLVDDGVARITVVPGRNAVNEWPSAYVDLRCANGAVRDVATVMAEHPEVFSIHHTAGTSQLMIVLAGGARMPTYLLQRLSTVPGVLDYAVHVVTDLPFETYRWQPRALTAEQQNRLRPFGPDGQDARPLRGRITELDTQIMASLCLDGRAGYREIAAAIGISPPVVARRLGRLLRERIIGLRCDVTRRKLGLTSAAFLRGSVDSRELVNARTHLGSRVPELRLITTVAGGANAHLSLWLRSASDLFRVEHLLTRELPSLRITDRIVVLQTMKLMGHLLDENEDYVRTVPIQVGHP